MEDEAGLIGRARGGDRDALSELLERNLAQLRSRMAGAIAPIWRALLDEDDIIQVTCLEAFLYIKRFEPRGPNSFLVWLRRIAENNLRDAVEALAARKRPSPRNQIRDAQAGEHDSYVALCEYLGATTTTPSRQAVRRDAKAHLLEAISSLPEDYRRVIMLYDLEEKDASDVASMLSRSVGAVYMLRARAHDRLRELLGTASRFISTSS